MTFDLNNSKTWAQVIPAPLFDLSGYQDKLDSICGLNPYGMPNVKLTWMPDPENWSKYYTEWEAGFGTKYGLRAQYVFDTIKGVDVPPPRWAFKQWLSGAQYVETDNIIRWKVAYDGDAKDIRETRPPFPLRGMYIPHPSPLMRVARHNGFCCETAKTEKRKCYGRYRAPDESYLILLRQAVERRAEENAQDPNAPLSEATLQRAALETAHIIKQKEESARQVTDDFLKEHWKEIVGADVSAYSFSKGGILLPN